MSFNLIVNRGFSRLSNISQFLRLKSNSCFEFSRNLNGIRNYHTNLIQFGPTQNQIEAKLVANLQSSTFSISKLIQRSYSVSSYHHSNPSIKQKKKVCIVGGGSWGTAVADLISYNVIKYPEYFDSDVTLYLRDRNLCQTIIDKRENVKYLPTIRLQSNLNPITSLEEALLFADIIVFAIPHEFVVDVCYKINDLVLTRKPIVGVSLIKGLHFDSDGQLERISEVIERMVGIKVGVLSGANIALEVARRQYCEATLCPPKLSEEDKSADSRQQQKLNEILCALFSSDNFKVRLSHDQATVELCGALKNVIACGVGLIDGMNFGLNTKAAAIACGFRELVQFVELYNPGYRTETLFDNCGVADLIASSFGGRNRKVSEAFAIQYSENNNSKPNLAELERKILKGQKLQGPNTARAVYQLLSRRDRDLVDRFPFFSAVHLIFNDNYDLIKIIDAIRKN